MIKFLLGFLYMVLGMPLYLQWARRRTDRQIDKMQEAAFNTPGAEAPITPEVMLSGAALLCTHFVFGQKVLGLRIWQTLLTFLLGAVAGIIIFLAQRAQWKG